MKEYIFKQYLGNVLKHLDITTDELFEDTKKSEVVRPRQMLYYLCREKGSMQFTEIRNYLSKAGFEVALDTIIYGSNSFKSLLQEDKDYNYIVKKLESIEL
jgi:chromosomal replication initiation ATPase DnaA